MSKLEAVLQVQQANDAHGGTVPKTAPVKILTTDDAGKPAWADPTDPEAYPALSVLAGGGSRGAFVRVRAYDGVTLAAPYDVGTPSYDSLTQVLSYTPADVDDTLNSIGFGGLSDWVVGDLVLIKTLSFQQWSGVYEVRTLGGTGQGGGTFVRADFASTSEHYRALAGVVTTDLGVKTFLQSTSMQSAVPFELDTSEIFFKQVTGNSRAGSEDVPLDGASLNALNQSDNISPTPLLTAENFGPGLFTVNVYLDVKVAGTLGTAAVTVYWQDAGDVRSYTLTGLDVSLSGVQQVTFPVQVASAGLSVEVTGIVTPGALSYDLYVWARP